MLLGILGFEVLKDVWEENIRDTLKKPPKEHIYAAHMWATKKVKEGKIPRFMKL